MIGYSLISIAFILAIDFGKIKMLHLVCFVGAYPETQYVPDVSVGISGTLLYLSKKLKFGG
jgi:hypothetical protein